MSTSNNDIHETLLGGFLRGGAAIVIAVVTLQGTHDSHMSDYGTSGGFSDVGLLLDPSAAFSAAYGPLLALPDLSALIPLAPWAAAFVAVTAAWMGVAILLGSVLSSIARLLWAGLSQLNSTATDDNRSK